MFKNQGLNLFINFLLPLIVRFSVLLQNHFLRLDGIFKIFCLKDRIYCCIFLYLFILLSYLIFAIINHLFNLKSLLIIKIWIVINLFYFSKFSFMFFKYYFYIPKFFFLLYFMYLIYFLNEIKYPLYI